MSVRLEAYKIVHAVYTKKAFVNIELSQAIRNNNLSDVDKAFLTRLVYGTLQNDRLLDYEINKVVTKELKNNLRYILRLGLYQMRYMDKVPSYAIINDSVEIAKTISSQAANFVNAILRRLDKERFEPKKEDYKDAIAYESLMYSHPEWLVRMIGKHYGEDKALEWMKNNRKEADIVVRVNTLKSNKEELLKLGCFKESMLASSALIYTGKGNPSELKEFSEGKFVIQDASGQLVAPLLDPKPHDNVLDMCAAPGSKTYHIAALMKNLGTITACDVYEHRLKLLTMQLKKLGISCVSTLCVDSTDLTKLCKEKSFDKVLLDAPCSGLGVIRRKPDILFNLKQEDLDGIISLQRKLIDQAVKLVKNKGTLVYSTCTLDKKENENQVQYLLNTYPQYKLIESNIIMDNENDGFFMAKFINEGSI